MSAIQCTRSLIAAALSRVVLVAARNSQVPVAGGVRITPAQGQLTFDATCFDQDITVTIPADASGGEPFVVPAHRLHDLVSQLSDEPVRLEIAKHRLRLRSGQSWYDFATLPRDEFPLAPQAVDAPPMVLDVSAFRPALHRAATCVSTAESRPALCGVHVARSATAATLRATDGTRLVETRFAGSEGADVDVIIPRQAVAVLLRLSADAERCALRAVHGRVAVDLGSDAVDTTLTSRLIDASYPDFSKFFNVTACRTLAVAANTLAAAVRRVTAVGGKDTLVRLKLADGALSVAADAVKDGGAEELVAGRIEGATPTWSIWFQPPILLGVLALFRDDDVTIAFTTATQAAIVRDASDTLAAAMPVRDPSGR